MAAYPDIKELLKTTQVSHVEFFNRLFEIRDVTHFTHLNQRDESLATHLALAEVYEGILPIIDGIIEGYSGKYGIKVKPFISGVTATDSPLIYIEQSYLYINSNKSIFTDSWIHNELDNISKILAIAMYKLRFVK